MTTFPLKTTWTWVLTGDTIKGGDGQPWRVLARNGDTFAIVNGENKREAKVDLARPVVILARHTPTADDLGGADPHEVGVALAQVHLSGVVVAERPEGAKGWRVPGQWNDLQSARSHLFLMHGVYAGDLKTREGLTEAHDLDHAEPVGNGYMDHWHDPAFNPAKK